MKRIITAMLILAILFSLVACQPTPEKGVVIEKDTKRMLQEAQKSSSATNDGSSLSEQYGIPEDYQFRMQGDNGKLSITADAQVTVPGGSAMPIYRVRAAEFSQETVSEFFRALCGDTEMWISSGKFTRDQLQQLIIRYKKRIAEIKDDPQSADELAMNKQLLAQSEQLLGSAPDTLAEIQTDGTLLDLSGSEPNSTTVEEEPITTPITQIGGTGTGLEAYERFNGNMGRAFYVKNDSSPSITFDDFRNPAAGSSFGLSSSFPVLKDSDINSETLSKVGLKPSEAKQMVLELLEKTKSDMVVDSIYLQDDTQYYDDGTIKPAEHYAYIIYCVRTVNGLTCSCIAGESKPEVDSVAPSWRYEQMYFMVNDEGIFNMLWTCPLEVVETVNEDALLKPFSEIQIIFEKMMSVKYEAQAEHNVYNFDINRVTLSLHRIIEQNTNESGLLVPAWNFYGKWVTNPDDPVFRSELIGASFLTINAIDGSIIDIYKGY